ncbi:hypothetical protein F0L68_00175 [Solihabitans fulvus]|uniref:PPE family protein n=1 Tax=Solihabitans fulvus TaxID=1892852 RepID=A0A5B2XW99_9PSEU|nr:hypothetical protein [Solihabitans fulvus]KAA2266991.1 hypothetical protein F0L68_00175 [Solihabitans fulvus]
MASLSAADIYKKLRGGQGGGTVADASQAAYATQQEHTDLENRINALIGRMDSAWQGDASAAAQAGAAPLARVLAQSQGELDKANQAMLNQHTTFFNSYHEVVPVPDTPPSSNLINDATPWKTDLVKQISDYNDKAHKNVQIYDNYVKTSSESGSALPSSYMGLSSDQAVVSVATPAPTITPPGQGQWDGVPQTTRTANNTGTTSRQPNATSTPGMSSVPGINTPAGNQVVNVVGNTGTDNSNTGTAPIGSSDVGGPPGSTSTSGSATGTATGTGTGLVGGNTGTGLGTNVGVGSNTPGVIGGPAGLPGRFVVGGPLSVDGKPSSGVGLRGNLPGGIGAGTGNLAEKGLGSGPKAGALAAEEAAAARGGAGTAGARGAAGQQGVGGMASAGRGKGGEDGEHRSAGYLHDDYSGDIVGELPLVAPPVLGED